MRPGVRMQVCREDYLKDRSTAIRSLITGRNALACTKSVLDTPAFHARDRADFLKFKIYLKSCRDCFLILTLSTKAR